MWNPQNLDLTISFCSLFWSNSLHFIKEELIALDNQVNHVKRNKSRVFFGEAGRNTQRQERARG